MIVIQQISQIKLELINNRLLVFGPIKEFVIFSYIYLQKKPGNFLLKPGKGKCKKAQNHGNFRN